jgi:copper chaperone
VERVTLTIDGMTCGHCVGQVTDALGKMVGVSVEQVKVGAATLSFDPRRSSVDAIRQAVEDQGYPVTATAREPEKIER